MWVKGHCSWVAFVEVCCDCMRCDISCYNILLTGKVVLSRFMILFGKNALYCLLNECALCVWHFTVEVFVYDLLNSWFLLIQFAYGVCEVACKGVKFDNSSLWNNYCLIRDNCLKDWLFTICNVWTDLTWGFDW